MNFNFEDLNALYDDGYDGLNSEPRTGDEWYLQRMYGDEDPRMSWWNGLPEYDMKKFVEVLALAVVQ